MRTYMNGMMKTLGIVALAGILSACGSGLSSGGSSSSGNGNGSGSKSTSATSGTSLVELGNGNGTSFVQGALSLQVNNLSAGGSTNVTANLVDANNGNALYTAQSVTVTFTSNCVSAGTATLTSSVSTSTGTAIATYTAQGCSGSDPIKATALVGSTTLTATVSLTVQAATLGNLVFSSATPEAISLQGVGGVTTSKVVFQLTDVNGNAVPNETVDFALSTTAGGVTLSPTSAITSSTGQAATFVTAGTVHTTVNVIATVASTTISTQTPNAIAISTGIPVQTHFSLAITTHNLEAFNVDGVTDSVGVYAVDRYGNPASPGTNILFITNSGVIYGTCPGSTAVTTACGSCQTDATGHCTVTWASEGNRPLKDSLDVLGHAHILAYTAGEEHYTDVNGDGVFNTGDAFSECNCTLTNTAQGDTFFDGYTLANSQAPAFDDIGDPYMDSKEVGYFISGEFFADIDSAATKRRAPNGEWYGAGCGGFSTTSTSVSAVSDPVTPVAETVTCANTLTMVGKDDCIIMSTSGVVIVPDNNTFTQGVGVTATYDVYDLNGNAPPSGMTFVVQGSGASASVQQASVPDIGCASASNNPGTFTNGSGATIGTGTYQIQVTVSANSQPGTFYIQATSPQSGTISTSGTITVP